MPSPNIADFDGDGDLDLLCGEFLDGLTYFENAGDRNNPRLVEGRRLTDGTAAIRMDLQMIVPSAVDWDGDGDVDLVVGDEDGRVAFVEHTGRFDDGLPILEQPRYFRQVAEDVKFGALVTPVAYDWDGDGDEDLICGNTAGYVGFIENLDGGNPPKWAEPVRITAAGETLRIQAGENGSIQGPCEAKWGYTTLSVADWDHDGLADLVVNSIWGKIVWYRNEGTRTEPRLAAAQPIQVDWQGQPPKPAWNWWDPQPGELSTQWRTTPLVYDLDGDNRNDLISLDHEGYLAFFPRQDDDNRSVAHPQRIFFVDRNRSYDSRHRVLAEDGGLLQLNGKTAGGSGRRKMCLTDWDGDGLTDLIVNSVNVHWIRQKGRDEEGRIVFEDRGAMTNHRLAGHTTSPTTVDFDGNGVRDLLIGAEDGFFYLLENPRKPE